MNEYKDAFHTVAKICKDLQKENEELKGRIAFLKSTTNQKKTKKKSRINDIGLKLISGGKKFEDQPPFAPQTPS